MKSIRWLALALALLPLAGAVALWAADDAATANKKALAELQGHWQIDTIEVNGQPQEPDENTAGSPVLFDGNNMSHGDNEFAITIDALSDPKLIDVRTPSEQDPERTIEGIYKIQDNRLTICIYFAEDVRQRPIEFSTEEGSQRVLITLTRIESP